MKFTTAATLPLLTGTAVAAPTSIRSTLDLDADTLPPSPLVAARLLWKPEWIKRPEASSETSHSAQSSSGGPADGELQRRSAEALKLPYIIESEFDEDNDKLLQRSDLFSLEDFEALSDLAARDESSAERKLSKREPLNGVAILNSLLGSLPNKIKDTEVQRRALVSKPGDVQREQNEAKSQGCQEPQDGSLEAEKELFKKLGEFFPIMARDVDSAPEGQKDEWGFKEVLSQFTPFRKRACPEEVDVDRPFRVLPDLGF